MERVKMEKIQVSVESCEDEDGNFCATLVAIVDGGTPEAETVWDNVETNWFPTQSEAIGAARKTETPFRAKITAGLYEANSYGTFIIK
ncbi:MAG: hypothetical protein DRP56_10550 [Planctomycetota bacterium]|nr:MAG: hypothetical protein DRP56_10550 [Planctomycetota bacterium]